MGMFYSLFFCLFCFWSLSFAATPLEFDSVYNVTFPENVDTLYFQVFIPYNPLVPPALRTVIITYVPFEPLNVSASFINEQPSYNNSEYIGANKDGSYIKGTLWVDDVAEVESILFVAVTRIPSMTSDYFSINVEFPQNILNFPVESRFQTDVEIDPMQTKWFLVNYNENEPQFLSAVRAEFCDEANTPVEMSLVFPETNLYDEGAVVNPCGCDDTIIENRDANIISSFTTGATQMFILPVSVTEKQPVYVGLFYSGHATPPEALKQRCPAQAQRKAAFASYADPSNTSLPFHMRISLYGQELYPVVRTKYTKPDRVNDDLIANVDDTPYCDFWASPNFTIYLSPIPYFSFGSACFLEKYADNFTTYVPETLVGEKEQDRVLIVRDFYTKEKLGNDTYFNIVHGNQDCGSYSYYMDSIPLDGWQKEIETKREWTTMAIGMVVVFGFLFAVFFITTILLISRLREYTRYRKI